MCGIAAIYSLDHKTLSEVELQKFRTMAFELEHRGPDSFSIMQPTNYLALSHSRLSINGLHDGDQPFVGNEGITVVNGEIYNFRDLSRNAEGYVPRTSSDCEILGFYGKRPWRLAEVQGMYAFIHWSVHRQCLIFGRDRFGEKPLYMAIKNDKLLLCSEQKPLIRYLGLRLIDLCPRALSEYFLFGYNTQSRTLFNAVKSVSKNGYWTATCGGVTFQEIQRTRNCGNLSEESYEKYVLSSTLSDIPITLALSGGVDSTYLACLLRDKIDCTYTVGYEAIGGSNEVDEAKNTARILGLKHKSLIISDREVSELFIKQVNSKDAPVLDFAGIGYYKIYEAARNDGFKVVLLGHGGDELGLGYEWLRHTYEKNRARMNLFFENLSDFRVSYKLNKMLFNRDSAEDSVHFYYPNWKKTKGDAYKSIFSNIIDYWLEPNTLRMGDSLSMSCSVEARQPLLSPNFIDSTQLEYDNLFEGKRLFKKSIAKVSELLIQKKKVHFAQPYMHYYSLIHNARRGETCMNMLPFLSKPFLERFYLRDDFVQSAETYYMYAKVATLDTWLSSIF